MMIPSVLSSVSSWYGNQAVSGLNSAAGSGINSRTLSGILGKQQNSGADFKDSVLQTWQSLGINLPNTTGNISNDASALNKTDSSQSVQALNTFMHDLFQALNQTNTSTNSSKTATATGVSSAYNSVSNNLTNLIATVSSSASSPQATTKLLQTDFNNLINSASNHATPSHKPSNASLQNFLQQLQSTMSYNGDQQYSTGSIFAGQA